MSSNSLISNDVLIFGNGTEDRVDTIGGVNNSTITFGSGPSDGVAATYYTNDSVNGNHIPSMTAPGIQRAILLQPPPVSATNQLVLATAMVTV